MKKIMVSLIVLSFLFVATSSFAATVALNVDHAGGSLNASAPATATICKLSNNVTITAQYSGTGYTLATYHQSGTKSFLTGYDATAIYFKDIGVGGTLTVPSSSVTTEAIDNTWTKM